MVDITNIINVSTAQAPKGLGFYQVNNVMIISGEQPITDWGTDKYRAYMSYSEVVADFGSDATTSKMAKAVFAQTPNIKSGDGQLLIGTMQTVHTEAVQASGSISFSANLTSGSKITIGETEKTLGTDIDVGADLAETLANIVAEEFDGVSLSIGEDSVEILADVAGVAGNSIALACDDENATVSGATLTGGANAQDVEETVEDALVRLAGLVYFGCAVTTEENISEQAILSLAGTVSTMDCIFCYAFHDVSAVNDGGIIKSLFEGNYTKFRPLLYTVSETQEISAGYVSRAMATNFNAQNSCLTINLKDLTGFAIDTAINQTVFNKCKQFGADVYTSIEGLAKVFSNSNGLFFDQVFNRLWFTQALKVKYFNCLATTSTKIPQTEKGMAYIKSCLQKICEQAVINGFCAPGTWNGSDKFGNPEDFDRNIQDFGFFIYSQPVAEQQQEERTARKAPVIQIAVKEAGAIHSGSIIVNFEA